MLLIFDLFCVNRRPQVYQLALQLSNDTRSTPQAVSILITCMFNE